MANTYECSDGTRVLKSTIDSRVKKAKAKKLDNMNLDQGFIACEECGINASSGVYLDCSHTISVKECQESGRSELAYNVDNLRVLCRRCHGIHDKNILNYKN